MKRGKFVGDLHAGSNLGMLPPDFVTSAGQPISQNVGQKYLWDCWTDMVEKAQWVRYDFLVVMGDVIDGCQKKQRGTELALPLMNDQVRAAVTILDPLITVMDCPVYFIQGTEYHDLLAGAAADQVAQQSGGVEYTGIGAGIYSHEVLDLEVEKGVVINCSHGIGVGAGFYRATALDREGIFSALAGKEGIMPKADIVARAHAHHFVHLEHASKHIFINPCWQLQTRFMRKNSVYRMIPDIGTVDVIINAAAKENGDDPCEIKKHLYRLPPYVVTPLLLDESQSPLPICGNNSILYKVEQFTGPCTPSPSESSQTIMESAGVQPASNLES